MNWEEVGHVCNLVDTRMWLPFDFQISPVYQDLVKRNETKAGIAPVKKTHMCLNIALSRVRNILECAFNVMKLCSTEIRFTLTPYQTVSNGI